MVVLVCPVSKVIVVSTECQVFLDKKVLQASQVPQVYQVQLVFQALQA